MPNLALVTGASSGIGKEIARYHASKGGDLIITARRKSELDKLKRELEKNNGISVHVISVDLGEKGAAEKLHKFARAKKLKVDILINNAGFGGRGVHTERDLDDELAMIDLNVKSLVALTHKFGKDMVANGGGKILNVGSSAGFFPGPLQAVYFATKAFVNSYSQAVDQELRSKGVTCSVLTPGYVETEFADRADLHGTDLAKGGKSASSCAKIGYDGMMAGKLVIINEFQIKALSIVTKFLPRRLILKMVEKIQKK